MSVARSNQRTLYRLASAQSGVVSRGQLIGIGIGRKTIESWRTNGRLIPAYLGTYALGRPADSIEAWWMAAILAAGNGAVLAGFSAITALGCGKENGFVEVARPRGRVRRLSPALKNGPRAVVRKSALLPEDVTSSGGIPCMTLPRALLDIAGKASPSRLRREFIEAGRHGLLTNEALVQCRVRGIGFTGHSRLVRLADAWSYGTGRIRSQLEGEFRVFCFERGIPAPVSNAIVAGFEVDALWEAEKLVVELDGRQFHDDGVAFERDREKANRLIVHGYTVIRITWKMLAEDPDGVERMLRIALACR